MKTFTAALLAASAFAAYAPQEISMSQEEQDRMEQASLDYMNRLMKLAVVGDIISNNSDDISKAAGDAADDAGIDSGDVSDARKEASKAASDAIDDIDSGASSLAATVFAAASIVALLQ